MAPELVRTASPRAVKLRVPLETEIDLRLPVGTLDHLAHLHKQQGDIFKLSTRGQDADTYIVACPDAARQVLSTQHSHYSPHMLQGNMALVLGRGLLISDGEHWKSQRKLLQRCFHGAALERLFSSVAACNARFLDHIRLCDAATIELTDAMVKLSIDFNFATLFGADASTMLDFAGEGFLDRLTTPSEGDTRAKLLFLKEVRRMRGALAAVMGARRQRGPGYDDGADLLDMFLGVRTKNGEAMPDEMVVDELINILTAGHATIASALKSIWYLIARHPAAAIAIRDEARRARGASAPAADLLAALPYTQQCIREAMRLYPPAWIITHQANRETRVGDHHAPAGTNVFVSPYLIHRHRDFWPSPELFDPDRFAPDAVAARHTHAYLPYSLGPRNCIGDDLSLTEMTLHVATALRDFNVVHVDGEPGDYGAGFLLRDRAPIHVRFERWTEPQ